MSEEYHKNIMELKDITKEAVIVSEEATFAKALTVMVKKQTNSLLVTNSDGELSGEVSVSDLLDAIVPNYLDGDSVTESFDTEEKFKSAVKDASSQIVQEFMSIDVDPVQVDDDLMTVAAHAISKQRARIPVVDKDNRPVGIISRRGLKHILAGYLGIKDEI